MSRFVVSFVCNSSIDFFFIHPCLSRSSHLECICIQLQVYWKILVQVSNSFFSFGSYFVKIRKLIPSMKNSICCSVCLNSKPIKFLEFGRYIFHFYRLYRSFSYFFVFVISCLKFLTLRIFVKNILNWDMSVESIVTFDLFSVSLSSLQNLDKFLFVWLLKVSICFRRFSMFILICFPFLFYSTFFVVQVKLGRFLENCFVFFFRFYKFG